MKAYYETTITNPENKHENIRILLEGEWDGTKFVHYNEKGLITIVRKKEWILDKIPAQYNKDKIYYNNKINGKDINKG